MFDGVICRRFLWSASLMVVFISYPAYAHKDELVVAQSIAREENDFKQVRDMLQKRGYDIKSIKPVHHKGKLVLDVEVRRSGKKTNIKMLEPTMQIISEQQF